jgi:hypothetical protein
MLPNSRRLSREQKVSFGVSILVGGFEPVTDMRLCQFDETSTYLFRCPLRKHSFIWFRRSIADVKSSAKMARQTKNQAIDGHTVEYTFTLLDYYLNL